MLVLIVLIKGLFENKKRAETLILISKNQEKGRTLVAIFELNVILIS